MSTLVWPPIASADLQVRQSQCLQRELEWLLHSLQETLGSLKTALEDCTSLLSPEPVTLALSSHRTEELKGFITLSGTRVVKGDLHIRVPSLPPLQNPHSRTVSNAYKVSFAPTDSIGQALVIPQLKNVKACLDACLDVVDATRWTGDADNAVYISSQLRLLHESVCDARGALTHEHLAWNDDPVDPQLFDPPLPRRVSLHLSIQEAALVLHVRTLEPAPDQSPLESPASRHGSINSSFAGFGLGKLAQVLRGEQLPPPHDEADKSFVYKAKTVRVVDKIRVETQHPKLMAAMAKLIALDHTIAQSRRALDVVMDQHDYDDSQ